MSITKSDIHRLVKLFYAKVREDDLLAPIFATRISGDDWPSHEAHIVSFWTSIILKTERFEGYPMRKHLALIDITPEHFQRWLSLFEISALQILDEDQAKAISQIAHRIGQSFQMGLAQFYENKNTDINPFSDYNLRLPQ